MFSRDHRTVATRRTVYTVTCLGMLLAVSAAQAGTVPQVGTLTVNADTAVTPTFSALTTPPIIAEDAATDWKIGTTITLSAPTGFRFDTAPLSVTANINAGDIDLGPGPANPITVTPGETTIVFTVVVASTGASQITFTGIQLRAENCAAAAVGNAPDITVTINDPVDTLEPELSAAQLVDVTVVAGAINNFLVQSTPAVQPAGSAYTITLTARDSCNNPIANFDAAADIVITAAGGTGIRTFANGSLTVNDPNVTDNTALLPDVPGNIFNASGQGTFNVTSPIGEGPITISAALGAATGNAAVTWFDGSCSLIPATSTNDLGTPHVVTATVLVNGVVAPGVPVDFSVAGANTVGVTPGVPPLTNALGQTTFTYAGANTGVDTITAQFTIAGQLKTCTAQKIWVDPACTLLPATHVGVVGLAHTVNLSVTGLAGGLEGTGTFTITTGPNSGISQPFITVAGAASFVYNSNGIAGTDTIVASGTVGGIPFACGPVTKEWVSTGCGLTPSIDTNLTGTPHTVTLTVLKNGVPEPGVVVNFTVAGANGGAVVTVSGPTNGAGQATGTYSGANNGIDTITASGNVIVGGTPVPFSCTATKEWLTPACTLSAVPATPGQVGESVTATVAITRDGAAVAAGLPVTFNVISGPNTGLILNTATIAGGTASFTYNGNGGVGTDTIRASGEIEAVPFECTTTKTWTIDSTCTMTPAVDINPLGTVHTVTVTVSANGAPVVGTAVVFGIVGPNAAAPITVSNGGFTNGAGQITASYTGTNLGTDTITASGTVGADLFTCSAIKEWITANCSLAAVPATPGQVGETVTATATIQRSGVNVGAGVAVTFNVISGPNTGLVLNTSTGAGGTASFTYTGSAGVGTDTIRANGVIDGVPFECTTTKVWTIDSTCTMTPPTAINQVGTQHTVTVTVAANGGPAVGVPVVFAIVGPNAAAPLTLSNGGNTNASGQVTATYTGTNPGTDTITANGNVGGDPFTCSAVKEWITASCSLVTVPATSSDVGASVTLTSTVQRNGANVGAGVAVTFNVISGPNTGLILNTATGAGGTATFTYNGNGGVGQDTIRANGVIDGVPFECTTTKNWVDPSCNIAASTPTLVGTQHTVSVTVLNGAAPASGVNVSLAVTGANNVVRNAVTNGAGVATFTAYTGANAGTDTLTVTGNIDGVAFTCTSTKDWVSSGCALLPLTDSNPVGTAHTVTITVLNNAVPAPGVIVFFTVSGRNSVLDAKVTNLVGQAALTYTDTGNPNTGGTDTITADYLIGALPFTCSATKNWVRTSCSIAPLTDTNPVGSNHTVTVTVNSDPSNLPVDGGQVSFEILPGSPNAGGPFTRLTAGANTTTTASFTYTGNGGPGIDTIRVTGSINGVPFTCAATKTWITASCSITPATETNVVNTSHSVTTRVLKNGAGAPGVTVNYLVTAGPNTGKVGSIVTNGSGDATFTYTGTNAAGDDTIQASGVVDGVPFLCTATKKWIDNNSNIPPDVEDKGPNGGDGNNDGIKDSLQPNVATFPDINGHYVTIESPAGTTLKNVEAIGIPNPEIAPPAVIFPYGFFKFEVHGVANGGCIVVRIFLHGGPTVNTYYKFGPSPILPIDHFFLFQFDGNVGGQVNGDILSLHLCDGQRGDSDLTANGIIKEPGAPALEAENPAPITGANASCGACGPGLFTSLPLMLAGLWFIRRGRFGHRWIGRS